MTGRDLIRWIVDNHAEDLLVLVDYRDIDLIKLLPKTIRRKGVKL